MKQLKSLQHPLVKQLTLLRKDRKERQKAGRAVIEGKKLVRENAGLLKTVLTTDPGIAISTDADCYQVTPEIIKKISGVKNPEGILAEVEIPQLAYSASLKRLLVLENLNDPGNLGTLIRTALAFGWEGVYLLGNCCDPFNDKVIRASKGAVFRIPLQMGGFADLEWILSNHALNVWIADLEGVDVKDVEKSSPTALILGSEAHGPSDQVLKIGKTVTIPMQGRMESLNVAVAGGILLYSL